LWPTSDLSPIKIFFDILRILRAGVISADSKNQQVLDRLPVERERGITVKAQSAAMLYSHAASGSTYLLNLIDTPVSGRIGFRSFWSSLVVVSRILGWPV